MVPVELGLVIAVAVVPWPAGLPVALPLLVAASACRWARGRSWGEVATGGVDRALIGLGAGALALVLGVVLGTPLVEAVSARAVEWSMFPMVRGNASAWPMVVVLVAVSSLAMELALRGWLVERVLELSPGPWVLPVLCGAFAEAIVTPGDLAARIGAGLFGAGLGWIYCASPTYVGRAAAAEGGAEVKRASGRSVVASVTARVAFQAGAVVLEALRLIG